MELPDEAYLVALASIPTMGPIALHEALEGHTPAEAWDQHRTKKGAPQDLERLWADHLEAGVTVLGFDHPSYPVVLRDDPEPPAVLFCRGDLGALDRRRVAVVGTRWASQYGLRIAEQLGARLAAAEIAVVSGLALGIDGAAHRGLLKAGGAPPVGVVASGLDVVYPPKHRGLWGEVAEKGLLLTEYPLGRRSGKWQFPARNRIIAGLSEVVVVVESKQAGGSLYTADDALTRGLPLMAVPGPITSPVSRGTNRLIADGAHPVCDPDDVLLALGLVSPDAGPSGPPEPGGRMGRVLDATAFEAVTLETLAIRTGLTLPELAMSIDQLCRQGWLADLGGTYERIVPGIPASGA